MNNHPTVWNKQVRLTALLLSRKYVNVLLLTLVLLWLGATIALAQNCPLYPSPHLRVGYNVAIDGGVSITDYDTARLGAGWYHDYQFNANPAHPDGILYHQIIRGYGRTTPEQIQQLLDTLQPVVDANPGTVWMVGNEPDRIGQDGLTAQQYATFYHSVYTFIKQRDPSSRIAVGGIVQPTPIRLRYLDLVLEAYAQSYGHTLPTDIWNIHNFILPENCSWGVWIPPGLDNYIGEAIPCPPNLNDHGNLDIFKQQLRTFRQWMNTRGYRNYPLIVSEYGILLSKYHGYPTARVRDYMLGSFGFMLNTTDSQTGYPADGNRLVQEFSWFSLNFYEFDLATYQGFNGNLFDHDSRQIMPLGLDFENYVQGIAIRQTDLVMREVSYTPTQPQVNTPIDLRAVFANQGSVAAENVTVRFWNGDPRAGGQLIGATPPQSQVLPECTVTSKGRLIWTPNRPGTYTIFAELTATNSNLESDVDNNYASVTITVSDSTVTPTATATATPTDSVTPTASPTTTPSATPTPTPSVTSTATAIPSATATNLPATATATLSPTPTALPSATATSLPATATATLLPTPTPSATSTATAIPSATPTTTLPPTAIATSSPTPTPSVTSTATAIPSATPTTALTPTATATLLPTPTAIPSATATSLPATATATLSTTSTPSVTSTATAIPSATATNLPATATATLSTTPTPSATSTATAIPSTTPTAALTPTATATLLPTPTAIPSATNTATAVPSATATSLPATATATLSTTPTALPSATATSLPATATATLLPTPTAIPSATNTVTAVPSATATTVFTPPATATLTSTPTGTDEPTATSTHTATATPTLPSGDIVEDVDPGTTTVITATESDSGNTIVVTFPAGIVDQTTAFIFNDRGVPSSLPAGFKFAGTSFTLDAFRNNLPLDDFTFNGNGIRLELRYSDSILGPGDDELQLTLEYFDEATGQWGSNGITVVNRDPANNLIVFAIKHLTEFALFLPSAVPTATSTTTPTTSPTLPIVTPTATPTTKSTATSATTPTTSPTVPMTPMVTATYTPAPTPTATPTLPPGDVVVVVDPNNDTEIDWTSLDGSHIHILFPAGVVDDFITIVFNDLPSPRSVPNGFKFAGIAFTLDAYRNNLLVPDFSFKNLGIVVNLTYTDAEVAGLHENDLMLYYFDEATNTWTTDGITLVTRDPANNRLVFNVKHLTDFALFDPGLVQSTATPTATPTLQPTQTATATPPPTLTGVPTLPPLTPTPLASLALDVAVEPANPTAGQSLLYHIIYQNKGQVPLSEIALNMNVPQYTTWDQAHSTTGIVCANGGVTMAACHFTIGTLAVGASAAIDFAVTLDSNLATPAPTISFTVRMEGVNQTIYIEKAIQVAVTTQRDVKLFLPIIVQE